MKFEKGNIENTFPNPDRKLKIKLKDL